jgi:hypothetical protein
LNLDIFACWTVNSCKQILLVSFPVYMDRWAKRLQFLLFDFLPVLSFIPVIYQYLAKPTFSGSSHNFLPLKF